MPHGYCPLLWSIPLSAASPRRIPTMCTRSCPVAPVALLCALCAAPPAPAQPMFRPLDVLPGGIASRAAGLSADGTVAVGSSDDVAGPRAVRWIWAGAAGPTLIPVLPGGDGQSVAAACSRDGTTIVGQS